MPAVFFAPCDPGIATAEFDAAIVKRSTAPRGRLGRFDGRRALTEGLDSPGDGPIIASGSFAGARAALLLVL
jgi:hypothetical protein